MKTITLVRHAKSNWEDAGLPDIVRPLNNRGRETSLWMGKYIYHKGIRPQLIISSPATRALHTAVNLSYGLKLPVEKIRTDSSIYFGAAKSYLQILRSLPDTLSHVLLIGHEPDISLVAEHLTGSFPDAFPTCAVYSIEMPSNHWKYIRKSSGLQKINIIPKSVTDPPSV